MMWESLLYSIEVALQQQKGHESLVFNENKYYV